MRTHSRGFTMIELVLSLAVLGIITAASVPFFLSYQEKNNLSVAADIIEQSLYRAQVLSQASDGDAGWGVRVASGNVTVFKGATYALRDPAFDESFDISASIVPSGLTEIDFRKFTGRPALPGTLTLSSQTEARTVVINSRGIVN